MKKSRFSEHQVIKILKETESGRKVADVCRLILRKQSLKGCN